MRAWLAMFFLPLAAYAQTSGSEANYGERDRVVDVAVTLPLYPKPENYLPFKVTATTPFLFFVDEKSVSFGADRVVRYTLIAKSADGALNVSYEGMRCSDKLFRLYAFGRPDNTWSEARNSRWEPIRVTSRNAPRQALYGDFFCPFAGNVETAEEAVQVLKNGINPKATIKPY
jgi:hypothetical protein